MRAPLTTPEAGPEMLSQREAVISRTCTSLTSLAQQTIPLVMGLGVLAYGLKKMFKPMMDQ